MDISPESPEDSFPHLALFGQRDWGLIVYDEVHLLPAPVFQITASLQARRRLGLTATLVREDGKEDDVFALIGPKKYDVPWKEMEKQGWIAKAICTEVRIPLPEQMRMSYSLADARTKFRMASENPAKIDHVQAILAAHPEEPVLVIGMYLDQLAAVAGPLGLPVITGSTPQRVRDRLYADFKSGKSGSWRFPKSRTLPWTFPKRASPSRCQAPSARARRKRSVWAGSSVRRSCPTRPTSTRWSPGTRWSRTSRSNVSSFFANKATATSTAWLTAGGRRPGTSPHEAFSS